MGPVRVTWGKLLVELPGEIVLFLLFKDFLMLSGIELFQQPPVRFAAVQGLCYLRHLMRFRAQSQYDLPIYARPSRFCASTNPRGVGRKIHETNPSASSENAAFRTTFKCELASCSSINPVERICGR